MAVQQAWPVRVRRRTILLPGRTEQNCISILVQQDDLVSFDQPTLSTGLLVLSSMDTRNLNIRHKNLICERATFNITAVFLYNTATVCTGIEFERRDGIVDVRSTGAAEQSVCTEYHDTCVMFPPHAFYTSPASDCSTIGAAMYRGRPILSKKLRDSASL